MKKLRPPAATEGRGGEISCSEHQAYKLIRPASQLSPAAIATLGALRRYRYEVEIWNALGGRYALPQPSQFGLALPSLRPSQIAWESRR
jgi:hypothetical protein